jgi:hypothetical protein
VLPYELAHQQFYDADGQLQDADEGVECESLSIAVARDGWVEISVASAQAFVSPERAREVIAAIEEALRTQATSAS